MFIGVQDKKKGAILYYNLIIIKEDYCGRLPERFERFNLAIRYSPFAILDAVYRRKLKQKLKRESFD